MCFSGWVQNLQLQCHSWGGGTWSALASSSERPRATRTMVGPLPVPGEGEPPPAARGGGRQSLLKTEAARRQPAAQR